MFSCRWSVRAALHILHQGSLQDDTRGHCQSRLDCSQRALRASTEIPSEGEERRDARGCRVEICKCTVHNVLHAARRIPRSDKRTHKRADVRASEPARIACRVPFPPFDPAGPGRLRSSNLVLQGTRMLRALACSTAAPAILALAWPFGQLPSAHLMVQLTHASARRLLWVILVPP